MRNVFKGAWRSCRRASLLCSAVVLGITAILPPARAEQGQGALAQIRAAGVLRVGTTGDYPPFSFRDPVRGQFIGADMDLAAELAAALHVQLQLVPTTWRNLLADQAAGRFDVAMGGISDSAERRAQAWFSVPYLTDGKTPIARCAERGLYQRLAQIDRPAVRVIVNPGGTNERFARAHLPHASLRVFPDNVSIFDELVAGRADVMITDATEARLQQHLRPALCALHPEHPFDTAHKVYLLPHDRELRREVDRWLRGVLASGHSAAVLERWLAYRWPLTGARTALVAALAGLIDERLALMPDVARYKWNQGLAIEDLPRERQLLEAVRAQAQGRGLSPDRAEAFFAAQIEASKVMQRELFAQWRAAAAGHFDNVPDLATQIRPHLDALTPRLLDALAAVPGALTREQLGALASAAASPAAVDAALAPLLRRAPAPGQAGP